MKIVSVIIPVYNVERYLPKCIDSIINQTYKNLEIILVDDGSPDGCPALCDQYASKDNRIKVVHKQNGGLSSARNAGLEVATGDYVCFFDSDDYVEPDMLEKMLKATIDSKLDVCVCGYYVDYFDDDEKELSSKAVLPKHSDINSSLSLFDCESMLGISGYAWNKLYSRKFLVDNQLKFVQGVSLVEDLLFNSQVFKKGAKINFIAYAGYHYIQRGRVTLGVKYYENFFELKQMAIDAKKDILTTCGVGQTVINEFYKKAYVDVVWGTIKNLANSNLTKKEKNEKIKKIIKDKDILAKIKKFKPKSKKEKIKKICLLSKNIFIINFVVGR